MNKPYILGICGGSGSGKTYLLRRLMELLPKDKLTFISQDNYYKKIEEQIKNEDGLVNYDHPDSLNLKDMEESLELLISGQSVSVEEYTFNVKVDKPHYLLYKPNPIIILEGLFIYHRPKVRDLIDFKVFVEAEEHVKISRRLKRDLVERAYSFDETLRDYEKFVAPMYRQFVEPQRFQSDLIVPNNVHMEKAIEVIGDHLLKVLG
ncbi:MAG: uridine kinase [Bacteroidia bacterium]|nr:uridine kinase [Bacteroidia bacterium]